MDLLTPFACMMKCEFEPFFGAIPPKVTIPSLNKKITFPYHGGKIILGRVKVNILHQFNFVLQVLFKRRWARDVSIRYDIARAIIKWYGYSFTKSISHYLRGCNFFNGDHIGHGAAIFRSTVPKHLGEVHPKTLFQWFKVRHAVGVDGTGNGLQQYHPFVGRSHGWVGSAAAIKAIVHA